MTARSVRIGEPGRRSGGFSVLVSSFQLVIGKKSYINLVSAS